MKTISYALLAPLALAAVPAGAQSLTDTHTTRWAPSGKVPAIHHHPIRRDCRAPAARLHLSGKGMMHAPAAAPCAREIAAKARAADASAPVVAR